MKRALVFGASGDLASAIAKVSIARGSRVTLVTRAARTSVVATRFSAEVETGVVHLLEVADSYLEYNSTEDASEPYDAVFFTQALFNPQPLTQMGEGRLFEEVAVGLTDQIALTRSILRKQGHQTDARLDVCFTGSTSSYAGFRNTAVYCAVKHGLVGFVRAMNEEYADTNTRFWLFSMGSMDTEMGKNVPKQDRLTFLKAKDVAERIVQAVDNPTNMFEPEVLIRRRVLR